MPAVRGDGAGDRLGVAGEHHDAVDAEPRAGARRAPAASARGWSARPNSASRRSPSPSAIDGLAGAVQLVERRAAAAEPLGDEPRAAGPQRAAVDARLRAAARAAPRRPRPAGTGRPRSRAAAAQRRGQRMLGAALDGGDQRQRSRRSSPSSARRRCSCGEPERQRAGLVERDRAHAPRGPRAPAPPLIRMPRRAAPPTAETTATGTEIDQRARAGDDQQRERPVQPGVERRRRTRAATAATQQRGDEHHRRVDAREAVDEALRGRAAALRLLDERRRRAPASSPRPAW